MKTTLSLILILTLSFLPIYGASAKKGASQHQDITLYVSNTCPYCDDVLDYLKSVHRSVPIKNTNKDKNAARELREIGGRPMVPCLIVNGQAIYESKKIIEWMKAHKSSLRKDKIKVQ